ncbi:MULTISPECIES: PH domain-containing protein [Streptomyces]|uniref:PH domain-containing protein n=1 Tax=Streptomyces flaveolus TaxID=67297 RepID=A0ABV3A4A8_9ACTN|nr:MULTISPECIES: PH domain-containing protein [Streptomyces]KMS84235.1 membrane protein [Streptomyces regensis]KOG73672.1 membrane protein [Streptomyces antibioticus]KOV96638.1 membrane protein [Streptomyces sp. NRRL WC-3723]
MTTPDHPSPASPPPAPAVKDRVYRSPLGLVGGSLLLLLVLWLGFDALFKGHGRTPWLALAGMILIVPLVLAFTLRPAVFAGEDRLRVRNPFRVITLPWGEIAGLRSGYSNEVLAKSGAKYQLWAVPVSLRARKKAVRRQQRAAADAARGTARGGRGGALAPSGLGFGGFSVRGPEAGPARAESDQIMADLGEILERRGQTESAQGEITVRWAYEVAAPAVAGAVLLAILLAVG